jgi:hypothetical protein
MGDVVLQLHTMGEANRQRAGLQAGGGRHQLPPHRVAAFAVEHLAGAQVLFRNGSNVAAKTMRLAGRLLAQRR